MTMLAHSTLCSTRHLCCHAPKNNRPHPYSPAGNTTGPEGWDRPVLVHGDLSDRNTLADPDTLTVTGFLDWEMANIMPAYFEYVQARLSGGHQPEWRRELLDVLRSVLRCECHAGQKDLDAVNVDGEERYRSALAAWDAVVDVERIAQGYDNNCYWNFETGLPDGSAL